MTKKRIAACRLARSRSTWRAASLARGGRRGRPPSGRPAAPRRAPAASSPPAPSRGVYSGRARGGARDRLRRGCFGHTGRRDGDRFAAAGHGRRRATAEPPTLEAFAAATRALADGTSLGDGARRDRRARRRRDRRRARRRPRPRPGRQARVRSDGPQRARRRSPPSSRARGSRSTTLPAAEVDETRRPPGGTPHRVERAGGAGGAATCPSSREAGSSAPSSSSRGVGVRPDRPAARPRRRRPDRRPPCGRSSGEAIAATARRVGARALELAGEALAVGSDRHARRRRSCGSPPSRPERARAVLWRREATATSSSASPASGATRRRRLARRRLARGTLEGARRRAVGRDRRRGRGDAPARTARRLGAPARLRPRRGARARTSSAGSRSSASAPRTRSARPSTRGRSRSSSSARARCSPRSRRRTRSCRSRTRSRPSSAGSQQLLETDRIAVYLREDGRLATAAERALEGRTSPSPSGCSRSRSARTAAAACSCSRTLPATRASTASRAQLADARHRGGDRRAAARAGRGRRPARRLSAARSVPDRERVDAPRARSPRSSRWPCRTRVCTNARPSADCRAGAATSSSSSARRRASARSTRSRARSRTNLSLEATLDALARTIVELLGVDAAVIRMPDGRGEQLVPRALHVADAAPRRAAPDRAARSRCRSRTWSAGGCCAQGGRSCSTPTSPPACRGYALLVPFLEKGSTAVVLPIATPGRAARRR